MVMTLIELLNNATVTDENIENSEAEWTANPPDAAYENILRASIDEQ